MTRKAKSTNPMAHQPRKTDWRWVTLVSSMIAVIGSFVAFVCAMTQLDTERNNMRRADFDSGVYNQVGKPMKGTLEGCIASREDVTYEVYGGITSTSLWIVRCPNSTTSTTQDRGKAGKSTVITTEKPL